MCVRRKCTKKVHQLKRACDRSNMNLQHHEHELFGTAAVVVRAASAAVAARGGGGSGMQRLFFSPLL